MSGVQVLRSDPLGSTAGSAFVRAQWIYDVLPGGAYRFVEFGTYHCPQGEICKVPSGGGTREIKNNHWYAYVKPTPTSYLLLWDAEAGPGPDHYFSLYWWWGGGPEELWVWQVDDTVVWTQPKSTIGNNWGDKDKAGLERFGTSTIGAYNSSSLQYTKSGGPWVAWAGRDTPEITGSGMCGLYLNDTRWRAGQPTSAC